MDTSFTYTQLYFTKASKQHIKFELWEGISHQILLYLTCREDQTRPTQITVSSTKRQPKAPFIGLGSGEIA